MSKLSSKMVDITWTITDWLRSKIALEELLDKREKCQMVWAYHHLNNVSVDLLHHFSLTILYNCNYMYDTVKKK